MVLTQPSSAPAYPIHLLSGAKFLPSTGEAVVSVATLMVRIDVGAQRYSHRWRGSRWDKLSHGMPFRPNADCHTRDQLPDALQTLVSQCPTGCQRRGIPGGKTGGLAGLWRGRPAVHGIGQVVERLRDGHGIGGIDLQLP